MSGLKTYKLQFGLLVLALLLLAFLNISLGSVNIPISSIVKTLTGAEAEKETWQYIILNYRLPKTITAILTGSSLAVSGLLMQTLFRNPLAGPFELGISSGASLGVAILIMGGSVLAGTGTKLATGSASLAIAASAGSFLALLAVMAVASKIRDTMALLIIGLMFGSFTAAVVSILAYFSSMEKLQQYIFWSFGSLGNLTWVQVLLFGVFFIVGMLLSIRSIKALNSLLLGENYARSMGLSITSSRYTIILATSLLAGSATALTGPIAFVGLAVPHLTRQLFTTSNHNVLLPAVILYGAGLMLVCDIVAQWPFNEFTLPINAVTSIIGAPVVIWLLVRKRKMVF